ncbi:hypothetical protein NPX13_g3742 [Xylaria arbuscula]|uniref:HTH APSES-type domain-containing protein n=1 Tax=Xylaria arbuscula TaxID=114810 RepID=A0A9W8NGR5_9PEZI|nr:hypothetical protein NPX13_g3742 [Xylaria arbuscula]
MPKHKMPKDAAVFTKGKTKGAINFSPYEDLDEESLRHTRIFEVFPLGRIREFSRHIPYNSGKKDFFEKTGRESFEVFQYVFKVPGDDTEYAVMWDYNVGLVRMTPFFKCCKYPKTTPAKMLNSNPGLKEITHSITGGSIMAQGYWMPYQCAKAVCATFCHNISGALIPIFGPDFPALCEQVDAPEYSRMVIDPTIVIQSTREAEYYRRLYSNTANLRSQSRNDSYSNRSPKREHRELRDPYEDHDRRQPRYYARKPAVSTPRSDHSTYTTDTEGEALPLLDRASLTRGPTPYQHPRFPHSTIPPIVPLSRTSHVNNSSGSSWTPANGPHSLAERHTSIYDRGSTPDPTASDCKRTKSHAFSALSQHTFFQPAAVAPADTSQPHEHLPPPSPRTKRPAAYIEEDRDRQYHARQSQVARHYHANKESYAENRSICVAEDDKAAGADKKAALLLMNLSVREPSTRSAGRKPGEAAEGGGFDLRSGGRAGEDEDGRYHQSGVGIKDRDAEVSRSSRYSSGAFKVGSGGMSMLDVVPRSLRCAQPALLVKGARITRSEINVMQYLFTLDPSMGEASSHARTTLTVSLAPYITLDYAYITVKESRALLRRPLPLEILDPRSSLRLGQNKDPNNLIHNLDLAPGQHL